MLVTRSNLSRVLANLRGANELAVDTETTGLDCYGQDRLFSIIVATSTSNAYYFNYHQYPGKDVEYVLERGGISSIFGTKNRIYYMHNAKFDMAMLHKEGVTLGGTIHCTMAIARLLDSNLPSYSLFALAPSVGFAKSTAVEDNIKKNKLYTIVTVKGKKKKEKRLHYDRVPMEIMVPYGEQDALATFALGHFQRHRLGATAVYGTECKLTKALFDMELAGIRIDRGYCEDALRGEHDRIGRAKKNFERISGVPFEDKRMTFIEAFTAAGETVPKTKKGNPCFDKLALEKFKTPLAGCLLQYRDAYKRAGSYFQNFLEYSDADSIVHCNMNQSGCKTGRMSVTRPALQTLNKEDDVDTIRDNTIRRAFIPKDGYTFFMLDYDQVEFRAMLDVAGQTNIIERINDGVDVHQAVADYMHTKRKAAKTINFMLLYGGGAEKLAAALGISFLDGIYLRRRYFRSFPKVAKWINAIKVKAESGGKITNKFGRVYKLASRHSYRAPNYYVQGSCADAMKLAIVQVHDLLKDYKSRLLLSVHDEIIVEVHNDEYHVVAMIKDIMESVWPSELMKLTVGVNFSRKSWADGKPWDAAAGDKVQEQGPKGA